MYELQLDADLVMGNGEFADVNLKRAHVSLLDLTRFESDRQARHERTSGRPIFNMSDQAEFAEVELTGAHVGGHST